jgi:hypothetical protein
MLHYCLPALTLPLPTHSLLPLHVPQRSARGATRVTRGEGGRVAKGGHVARGRRERATRGEGGTRGGGGTRDEGGTRGEGATRQGDATEATW